MNKRMIVNWLKGELTRAIQAVDAQAALNAEQAYKDIWEAVNLSEAAPRLQKAIDDFERMAKEFEATLDGVDGVTIRTYSRVSGQVYSLTNSTTSVEKYIKSMIDQKSSPVFQRIQKQKCDLEAGVRANYTAVIENIKNLKDAKTAMEYLEGLGFDLTALKKLDGSANTTAVAMPIDTRFLFLGGNA